ncbi:MAG TPA: GAF domain-containing sensor histidine kinase [Aggregatilineales bacterium]|nr:GAF domain-containing sensor histidine kinase [Aggregatilineales bacterium]
MDTFHPLLKHQLKKSGITDSSILPSTEAWLNLLHRLNQTYLDNDQERYLRERSLSLTTQEMQREIATRQQAEAFLFRQKRILEQIATDRPLEEILTTLIHTIESQVPDMIGSILLLDSDDLHIRHGAAPGLPEAYRQAVDGAAIGPQEGSFGTAAFHNKRVIVEDIANDSLWKNYRDLALGHDLRACWSQPIRARNGRVLGTFAMYYHQARKPLPSEIQLIEDAAPLAGIAIERLRDDEALRQSEARGRALLDAIPGVIFRVGRDGTILDFKGSDLLPDATRGFKLEDVLPLALDIEAILECGETQTFGYGQTYEARVFVSGADEVVILVRDIDEGQQAVKQRMDRAIVQEHARALQRFMEIFSHEFRTPLSVINISLHLLSRQADPALHERELALMQAQTRKLETLTEDVIVLSELNNAPKLLFESLDLNRLIGDIATYFQFLADAGGISVTTALQEGLPALFADEAKLTRALVYLVETAAERITGNGKIELRTAMVENLLVVEVHDSGGSLPITAMLNVFEHLERADTLKNGSRFSLAIVNKILELHHGRIAIERQNEGNTFSVFLPVDLAQQDRAFGKTGGPSIGEC